MSTVLGGAVREAQDLAVRMTALRRLYGLIGQVNGRRDLAATLQAVVDGVVEGLGFEVAVVNYVHPDGSYETVAVAGPPDARTKLLGNRYPSDVFDAEFAAGERWGQLVFVAHDRLPEEATTGWVPSAEVVASAGGPDAWHPMDALFAPLTSPSGELVGMLSVDLPHDRRRPGALQRELLEMFASQAGIAIDNARLTEQLHAEQALLVREQQRLRASEEAFRLAFDGAGVGMSMISLDPADAGRFLRVNEAMCAITGYPVEEMLELTFADITHPDDVGPDVSALGRAAVGVQHVHRAEKRYVRKDGRVLWVSVVTSAIRLESGEALYGISQVVDITARKTAEAELERRASQDALTGLANRTALRERLARAVGRAAAPDSGSDCDGAVLFCDLDGFKQVNDTYGHDVGDQVLMIVGARLAEHVRAEDTVARLGGDEFVLLVEGMASADVGALAERVRRSLSDPMVVANLPIRVTASIGVAPLRGDQVQDVDALLRGADQAMYRAKAQGQDRCVFAGAV
jgi:diguanylate cyclase (GGDEF)-like protein/PAS domain S-box-containing protein